MLIGFVWRTWMSMQNRNKMKRWRWRQNNENSKSVKDSSSCVFSNLNMIQHYSLYSKLYNHRQFVRPLFNSYQILCFVKWILQQIYTFHCLGIFANCLQFQISTEEIPPFFGPPLLPNEDFLEKIVGVVTSGSEMLINYKKGAL